MSASHCCVLTHALRRQHLIIHRDLKPANLMLAGIPPDIADRSIAQRFGVCKIADFGLSKSLALRSDDTAKSRRKLVDDLCEGNKVDEVRLQLGTMTLLAQ